MQYLIGVDLGTQGTKTSLLDENLSIVQEAFQASHLIYPEAGAVEQNPEEMLSSVLDTIREVMEKSGISAGDVAAIALDGQMAGVMAVDKAGMAVTPYDSWLDTRCGAYRAPFLEYGEERVIQITGAPVTYAHGPKKLWWKNEYPAVFEKIHKFVQPAAYLAMRMCGLSGDEAFVDYSYIHFSGFADTEKKVWSTELVDALDFDMAKLPRIIKPYDKIGTVTADMAARAGLLEGTPMVAGCGDSAATSLGAGVMRAGLMFDIAGTASVLAWATEEYTPDTKHKTMIFASSVVDGLYTPMAYINGGGMCLKWLRDDVLKGKFSYEQLNEQAQHITAGSEDLLFLPHFSGRVCPNDTLVRGSYVNLSWKHETAHLYRAIMEGIAYEYGIYTDILRELAPDMQAERIISVGGGSKSELFRQIKANVLGVPVSTIRQADTAALACCAIAGYGVGLYDSLTAPIEKTLTFETHTSPNTEQYGFYQERKDIYAGLFGALHETYQKLGAL